MEVPYKSFQKENKRLDKWVQGAKRKPGGAHLLEEGRLKGDQGSQCLTQVSGVTCKFRTLAKNLAEEGKWDEDCSRRSHRRRKDQGMVLFALKDGGDPELDDTPRERVREDPAGDRGDRWGRDGEVF